MRRNFIASLGALALGWLAGPMAAQEVMPALTVNNQNYQEVSVVADAKKEEAQAPAVVAPVTAPPVIAAGNDCPKRRWQLFAQADALYLQPRFASNPGLTVQQIQQEQNVGNLFFKESESSSTQDFEYGFSVSPRLWIGAENCDGLGIRGRWFRFEQAADPQQATAAVSGQSANGILSLSGQQVFGGGIVGGPGFNIALNGFDITLVPNPSTVYADSSLYLDVYDVEVTHRFGTGRWNVLMAGGARYAHIQQTSNFFQPGFTLSQTFNGALVGQFFRSSASALQQSFTGAGPMLALEVERQLGQGNFALVGSGRGALLYGKGRDRSTISTYTAEQVFIRGIPVGVDESLDVSTSQSSRYDLLPILEVETGGVWNRQLRSGVELFIRATAVAQFYFAGTGNGAEGDGPGAFNGLSDFGMLGGSLSLGVRY